MEANNTVKTTPSVTAAQATEAQLRAEIARLQGQLASKRPLKFQVAEKGGVSVYNLGRFPVTLYKEQWDRLIADISKLEAFIKEQHDAGKLALKVGANGASA
jgi:hypothetical protein